MQPYAAPRLPPADDKELECVNQSEAKICLRMVLTNLLSFTKPLIPKDLLLLRSIKKK